MFKHGQAVTLTDMNGTKHYGDLFLPDVVVYSTRGQYALERVEEGGYGVYTLTNPDGSRFRTEGRLSN